MATTKRANNDTPDTIAPAPASHKTRPETKTPKKAKPTAAEQVAKMRQTVLTLAPQPTPSELVMMPLELIDCAAQVRTLFDDASLEELAGDIAARGVLQPILLRPIEDGRYLVIAGERRLRACRLACLSTIPAIVGQIDDTTAEDMQLAENIQREDLNLKDTAAAVRRIYDRCGSVTETAQKVRKSKSWVSKHLSASCPTLRYEVRWLLDNELTDDLEIILTLEKIYQADYQTGHAMQAKIKAGEAGRQTLRDALNEIPARKEAREKAAEEQNAIWKKQQEEQKAAYDADAPGRKALEMAQLRSNPTNRLYQIERRLECEDAGSIDEIVDELGDEAQEILRHHLEMLYVSGTAAPYSVLLRMHAQGEHSVCEMAAFMAGMTSHEFNFVAILTAAREAMKGEE